MFIQNTSTLNIPSKIRIFVQVHVNIVIDFAPLGDYIDYVIMALDRMEVSRGPVSQFPTANPTHFTFIAFN